jgi:glycerophosphoryl diester phosphodiesterase
MHAAVMSTRPLVFAHRGGSALGPENTIPAFDRGLAAGADGLELDVHLSSDGIVVIHHDALLDRTTTASGPVAARTAAELAAIDATSRFSRLETRAGVPTLDEVLRRYPDARIIVELKQPSAALAAAVIDAVHAAGAGGRVCLGSFSLRAMAAARARDPKIATGAAVIEVRLALYRSWCRWPFGRTGYAAFQVPETTGRTRVVSPRFVRMAHDAGVVVQVWTVDAPDDIHRLLDWGVDAIITDRPDIAAEIVRARFSTS